MLSDKNKTKLSLQNILSMPWLFFASQSSEGYSLSQENSHSEVENISRSVKESRFDC
jgi:hypothetical protein